MMIWHHVKIVTRISFSIITYNDLNDCIELKNTQYQTNTNATVITIFNAMKWLMQCFVVTLRIVNIVDGSGL